MGIYSITQAYAKEHLDYDPETGWLTWKRLKEYNRHDRQFNTKFAGKRAGTIDIHGYRQLKLNKKVYYAHRIIWLWWTGEWPKEQIDHINGIPDDNRISNLRDVTHFKNQQNRTKPNKNNKSGHIGIDYCKRENKWRARFMVEGKVNNLGLFSSLESAKLAYESAKNNYDSSL